MATYEIIFTNDSSQPIDVCVYQQNPDLDIAGIQTVAWIVADAYPTTIVEFLWSDTYDFVWSELEEAGPDTTIGMGQVWPADLTTTNQVRLSYPGDTFTFEEQTQGVAQNMLYVMQDASIPSGYGYVGIGMSGLATFVTETEANINLSFPPDPEYWLTFGIYSQGELLTLPTLNASVQVIFPDNVYSMAVTLNSDNTLTVSENT